MARLSPWRRRGLAVLAGAAAALALPPTGAWPLLFVSFPLFLALLQSLPQAGRLGGFAIGWWFGAGYFTVALHWIGFAFLVDAATYLWMMPFMVGALAGGMAIYWGLAAMLARRFAPGGLPLALMWAASLGTAEWLRGHLFTGFPWAAPGQAADGMGDLAQFAAIVGMPGLTVLVVLWAGLPLALLNATRRNERLAAAILLALLPLCWGWGTLRLASAENGMVSGVALRIVQPNVGQDQKWREDNARGIFETLKRLSAEPTAERPAGIGGVTHVIWPESAVPFLIDESPVARAELKPLLGGRTVLITGAIRRGHGAGQSRIYNSIVAFDGNARPVARYDKWRLVPGGEFLPFAWLLEPIGFRRVVSVPGDFEAGPGPVTVPVPGAPDAAMLVCYEAIFPHDLVDPARRPGFILNVTNDGWFGTSTGPYQHLAQLRLRTIEQGLPAARAANTGISAVIDGYGRILAHLPLQEAGVIDSPLPIALPPPPYARFGDWTGALLVLLLAAAAIFSQKDGTKTPVRRSG